MLSSAFPSIQHAPPGSVHEVEVPELKNIVVVNDTNSREDLEKETAGVRSLIDFRDIFIWDESSKEGTRMKEIGMSLNKDDVINLHFTRCADMIYFSESGNFMCSYVQSGTTGSPKAVSVCRDLLDVHLCSC
jgi:hypothetical protein